MIHTVENKTENPPPRDPESPEADDISIELQQSDKENRAWHLLRSARAFLPTMGRRSR